MVAGPPRPARDAAVPVALWAVVAAAAASISLALGMRQTFGRFQLPLAAEQGLSPVWLGAVPLTSAAIARRFGVGDPGALHGLCFASCRTRSGDSSAPGPGRCF